MSKATLICWMFGFPLTLMVTHVTPVDLHLLTDQEQQVGATNLSHPNLSEAVTPEQNISVPPGDQQKEDPTSHLDKM